MVYKEVLEEVETSRAVSEGGGVGRGSDFGI